MKFLEPIISNHNHDDFEIYAFAELKSETSKKYKSLVDYWVPTKILSDNDLANKIREMQIDILVDLIGHTDGNRCWL